MKFIWAVSRFTRLRKIVKEIEEKMFCKKKSCRILLVLLGWIVPFHPLNAQQNTTTTLLFQDLSKSKNSFICYALTNNHLVFNDLSNMCPDLDDEALKRHKSALSNLVEIDRSKTTQDLPDTSKGVKECFSLFEDGPCKWSNRNCTVEVTVPFQASAEVAVRAFGAKEIPAERCLPSYWNDWWFSGKDRFLPLSSKDFDEAKIILPQRGEVLLGKNK